MSSFKLGKGVVSSGVWLPGFTLTWWPLAGWYEDLLAEQHGFRGQSGGWAKTKANTKG